MIYDITPIISNRLAVWPGDTPPRREVLLDLQRGDSITLSSLHATVHLGAHADAPSHYGKNAPTIDEVPLEVYLGRCQVVRVPVAHGKRVSPEMVPWPVHAERVLIATGTYPDLEQFTQNFAALEPELVQHLHREGVCLVGIDTPSVDLFDSKDLPTHQACRACGMAILEGLLLRGVPEGLYELIALPLKLQGFDASPVRAILRTPSGG